MKGVFNWKVFLIFVFLICCIIFGLKVGIDIKYENDLSEIYSTRDTRLDNYYDNELKLKIDVTNWNKGGDDSKIPLVKFTQAVPEDMKKIKEDATTLVAIANGRDVTKRRNARLEWDADRKILYYVQDKPSDGFKVIVR